MTEILWHRADDTLPPPRKVVMVTGESGYMPPNDRFLTLAYREPDYPFAPWRSMTSDALDEVGWHPTHWAERVPLPGDKT